MLNSWPLARPLRSLIRPAFTTGATRGAGGGCAASRCRNSRSTSVGVLALGFQPSRRTVMPAGRRPSCERLVAAPHVDVDVAPLDRRAGVHDRVDAVVALAQPVDLDDRPDRQQIRVGGGNSRPDVHPGRGRRPLAVGGGREPQLGARRRGGGRLTAAPPGAPHSANPGSSPRTGRQRPRRQLLSRRSSGRAIGTAA